jgi:hypothetical protein
MSEFRVLDEPYLVTPEQAELIRRHYQEMTIAFLAKHGIVPSPPDLHGPIDGRLSGGILSPETDRRGIMGEVGEPAVLPLPVPSGPITVEGV